MGMLFRARSLNPSAAANPPAPTFSANRTSAANAVKAIFSDGSGSEPGDTVEIANNQCDM
jgi:hypothetical protein